MFGLIHLPLFTFAGNSALSAFWLARGPPSRPSGQV